MRKQNETINQQPQLISEEYTDGQLIRKWKLGNRIHTTRNPTNLTPEEYERRLEIISKAARPLLSNVRKAEMAV